MHSPAINDDQNHAIEKPSLSGPSIDLNGKDVFDEDSASHQIRYKTLSWQFVACLMVSEIVSNGLLSLPSALAVVGIVPALVLIIFLGLFGLFTAKLLIDFKSNHPGVHNMGDAGLLMWDSLAREVLSAGTIIFAISGTGSLLLTGQQALSTLSDSRICSVYWVIICGVVTLTISLPRTLNRLTWLAFVSGFTITLSGVVAMIGAAMNPVSGRILDVTIQTNFYEAFLAVTNPVFAYAGHFIFFILISEMRRPQDAMKAACCLQGFATTFYVVFSIVMYAYIGNGVQSPALLSLPPNWAKASFAIALVNFLITGGILIHTAAKTLFIRLFRRSSHLYSHTILGWAVWCALCFTGVFIAVLFAVAVPIFSYLIGISASLFAAWYTYGLAGFFWIHDTYHLKGGSAAFWKRPFGTALAMLTVLAGAFICIAGTYVSIKLIADAYAAGLVGKPFSCSS
ncbi:transmembrane amino acid transporter protein-domain-containing protein [Phlebopus sp. FC_14]|nr:transmembrane amino acid transporter protein-domain-containing protein [Phlebopus sp. FC_14]